MAQIQIDKTHLPHVYDGKHLNLIPQFLWWWSDIQIIQGNCDSYQFTFKGFKLPLKTRETNKNSEKD